MDPVANITEQRELAHDLAEYDGNLRDLPVSAIEEYHRDAARLAELVLALDEWRQRGGFDPYNPPRPRYPLTRSV